MIEKAQATLNTVSYTLTRTDTFVTGTVRTITGQAKIKVNKSDKVFGFLFWGKRDGIDINIVYDGRSGIVIDHAKKEYSVTTDPESIKHLFGSPGGQVILPDLIRLDTSTAQSFTVREDEKYYYLTMQLPDITKYDVIKRSKTLRVDKKNHLPIGMRSHQETLGKVQDLNYQVTDLYPNDDSKAFNFAAQLIPADYSVKKDEINKALFALLNKPLPSFQINTFSNESFSSEKLTGKTVLLDFWEVWCGPCVGSLPKVQELYEKYKEKGLAVYGIINEKDQLEPSRLLVKNRKIDFPMLLGNEALLKSYPISAVPVYILVNKKGKISFISEGYPATLEEEIIKSLKE